MKAEMNITIYNSDGRKIIEKIETNEEGIVNNLKEMNKQLEEKIKKLEDWANGPLWEQVVKQLNEIEEHELRKILADLQK